MATSTEKYQDDYVVEDYIRDFVESVLKSVSNTISANWLDSIQTPLAADVALIKLSRIVSIATTSYDGNYELDQPMEKHVADNEPIPVAIDPWARGTVPTRKLPQGAGSMFSGDFDVPSKDPSVSSYSSVNSFASYRSSNTTRKGKSTAGRTDRSRGGGVVGSDSNTSGGLNKTGEIFELDEEGYDNDNVNMNASGHLFDMLLKSQRKLKNKEMLAGASNSKDDEDDDDEFKRMQVEIDKATKDLKGKRRYVVDGEGKPITVMNVKPETLPPYAVSLGLNISTKNMDGSGGNFNSSNNAANNSANDSNDKAGKGNANSNKDDKAAKKVVRVAGSRDVDDAFFTAVTSLASTLSGGQNINLNAGVSLKAGDGSVREGPPPPMDPRKVSRKNYFSKSNNNINGSSSSNVAASRLNVVEDSETGESVLMMEDSNIASEGGNGGDGIGFGEGSGMSNNLSASSFQVSMMSSRYPNINATEGGRKRVTIVTPIEQQQQKSDDKVKNKPAVLPTKPSIKQQENIHLLAGGKDSELPRDRQPPQSQIPPSSYKKLPAPALGKTTGHGLVTGSAAYGSPDKSTIGGNSSIISSPGGGRNNIITGGSIGGSPSGKYTVNSENRNNNTVGGHIKTNRLDISREIFK